MERWGERTTKRRMECAKVIIPQAAVEISRRGEKSEGEGIASGGRILTKGEGQVENFLHDDCAAEIGPGNARAEERGRLGG